MPVTPYKTLRYLFWFLLAGLGACPTEAAANASLELHARSRQAIPATTNEFRVAEQTVRWNPKKTAIIICDMWDQHWCKGAAARVAEMAPRMNEVIKSARRRGVLIIHAPSDTMKFYENTPQRKRAQHAPKANPPADVSHWKSLNLAKEGPLPIDDSDGGCDDLPPCPGGSPWKRQIATLEIMSEDVISDNGEEVYSVLAAHGIENVIILGVHTNMCVLGRPFSIRQMVSVGKNVLLMRDMTDTMYNSRRRPYVSHFVGTDLVVEHIEKYWCPSITSVDFLGGEPFRFKDDRRLHIVFIVGENEYQTWETLPGFARHELAWRGISCEFVSAPYQGGNEFANWQAIPEADLLFVSVRRRTPPKPMLSAIQAHLAAGKPLIGIRTASHAFDAKPPGDEHGSWSTFDRDVLGGHYQGHFGNNLAPTLRIPAGAAGHPVLTGVSMDAFRTRYSLYRSRDLAPTASALVTGTIIADGRETTEPVAWINVNANQRVFYTSLGGPDDFKEPVFRRLLLNGILWSLNRPIPPDEVPAKKASKNVGRASNLPVQGASSPRGSDGKLPPEPADKLSALRIAPGSQENPLSPAESLARFVVADDLEIEPVLAEPFVRQPVFLNFDERGRLWVVQYLQYPFPAGLNVTSRDNVWRAVYDKVPPPPPNHVRGEDKITVHEDTNGDGVFDHHKVFVEGLNIATSVVRGRGGVWVMNPPYLLFFPDRDNDDVPDGPPELRLSGFGLEDTHSVANSLRWGPDGWLYGCQGSTVTGNILIYGADHQPLNSKPIFSQGQNVWRYHPETRRYEIFAEGGGNAFGLEIDAKGRIFSGHNGGNTRGFHYVQGGYLQKGFEKHGPLSNPYAFGYFPPMPHNDVERFTHNFLVYDGGALPSRYERKLFGIEPLQGRVVLSDIQPERSSFRTKDLSHPVTTTDQWFRPVDIKLGPDGAIYFADWYDRQVNHYRNHEGQIDKSNGRIYRLKPKGAKPIQPFDLAQSSNEQLLSLLGHKNKWFRQEALRLLADRKQHSLAARLMQVIQANVGQVALEALWALHACGGFYSDAALEFLNHQDPYVRLWTIRLIGDQPSQSFWTELGGKLIQAAKSETNLEVRSQLASTAKRLSPEIALPILRNLVGHDEDTTDPRLPLLIWWALEAKAETDRDAVIDLFDDPSLWSRPIVQDQILERLARRYAMAGTRKDLLTCARLLQLAPSRAQSARLMSGILLAFKGRPMPHLPEELLTAMASAGGESFPLALRRGQPEAVAKALEIIRDPKADKDRRLECIQILGETNRPECVPVLLSLLKTCRDATLCKTALSSLRQSEDPRVSRDILGTYVGLPEEAKPSALALLASRPTWAVALLKAVDNGVIAKKAVPPDVIQRLQLYQEPKIPGLLARLWNGTNPDASAQIQARINQFAQALRSGLGSPYEGQKLFNGSCASCHKLFGQGGQIGPDLTAFKRDDLETMLLSIVNPNAEIREGYETYLVTTKDGQALSGFLADRDPQVVVLRGLDGENTAIPRAQIVEMKPGGLSLMPEGLLDALEDQQVRDLFAYLRSTQPLVR
ncbi:MAG: ThuA domain-containing protein [Verrucomicrobia bacterium]|nr:ThuA domain-containing protein [Verrucomicrobiota bacterium]